MAATAPIIDATVRRARPVVLTALAAILGMIPLARSVFWGPMAITIMGGLLVATILTLLVVPALYALWFRVRRDEPIDAFVALRATGSCVRPRGGAVQDCGRIKNFARDLNLRLQVPPTQEGKSILNSLDPWKPLLTGALWHDDQSDALVSS